ncbi:hypothetical protein KCG44_11460 [Pacificimonas sp. WHA3]|uniref:Uncharacterized protein n=1 Tax=Pacificimonas pallii TaxID=2827236 RepID=A0ABS6SH85_9SPHN|nr:hypothetical protein [Pacificimonas pallii]MBV7257403.1 hypothetical protein [Pacificimonas pallii]
MDSVNGVFAVAEDQADEPEFETPPVFVEQDERRMHVRAYNHWAGLLNGREFPAPDDYAPEMLDDFGANSVLLDFTAGSQKPVLRYVGDWLREECDLEVGETGVEAVPSRSLLSRLTDHYFEIIANRAPIGFEAEFTSRRGNNTLYRGILMPLSADGSTIDHVYGVINWKELAEPEMEAALAAEAGFAELSLAPTEGVDFADGADGADDAEKRAGGGVADCLTRARDAADALNKSDDRSRLALYEALSSAWDFHLSTLGAPDEYARLLSQNGLKVQQRAPMTPVVKLIFGKDYDKTRLTEYAAALSHAARADVSEDGFGAFIQTFDGGLKGMVKAERAARRAESAKPTVDRNAALRDKLRAAKSIAVLPLDVPGDEEFVLVVARRNADGGLGVVGAVGHHEELVDRALRRL